MQILELAAKLQSIGLSDKQAKVYVAALFLGPNSAQKISQQADVNRATTYVILEELMEMGLISQSSVGKKTVFVAEGADAIDRHIESVKKELEAQQQELKTIAPELESIARKDSASAPQVFFFKGKEGIEQINSYYFKHSKPKSTSYIFSDRDKVKEIIPHAFEQHKANRKAKQIATHSIAYDSTGELVNIKSEKKERKLVDIRSAAEITMQEDFVMFATYNTHEHVSVVLESPEIAKALRQIYDLAWQGLPATNKSKK